VSRQHRTDIAYCSGAHDSAMKFLESTDLVKIEDILPFFPDFVVIDDFKTEICSALEDYSARIEELKAEMDEATASAESIKRDIEGLANRFITIEPADKCWHCGGILTLRQFYVFPCQHFFHAHCLIEMVCPTVGARVSTDPRQQSSCLPRLSAGSTTSNTSWASSPASRLAAPSCLPLSRRPRRVTPRRGVPATRRPVPNRLSRLARRLQICYWA